MTPRKSRRRRHVPQRTCVGCREVLAKRGLIRVVRGPNGVALDPSGKAPGRGAYVHELRSCWERALKGSLSKALRTELTDKELEELSAYVNEMFNE
jgi:predicted RNA-binding protein YlxR (DUF448 family)